jgi:hypothetical protein
MILAFQDFNPTPVEEPSLETPEIEKAQIASQRSARLAELKDLHRRGLITETAYRIRLAELEMEQS